MRSIYDFVIEPLGERYNNTKKIDDSELILNTNISNFKSVNKLARVISTPLAYNTPIEEGDTVVVHHNVFRRFHNIRGEEVNSRSYFKENLYFCAADQLYLYNKDEEWITFLDRCFIAPIKNTKKLTTEKTTIQKGVITYGNPKLKNYNLQVGDMVSFKKDREFEFTINNQLLYCMKLNDIVVKYEHERNEEIYNPSWARSGEGVNKSSEGRDCQHRGGCICGPTKERSCYKETCNI